MNKYQIECEECNNISSVKTQFTEDEPEFCPMCGRRAICEEIEEEDGYDDT